MSSNARHAVERTIYDSALALDEQRWDDWLDLCAEDFYYAIRAFSPEINKEMTYLDGKLSDIKTMAEMLPKHNSDESPLTRHTVVYRVDVDETAGTAAAISSFAIYQTVFDGLNSHVEAGGSRLFLIGKYHDRFRLADGGARFVERICRLDTRRLDKGTHWPL